MFSDAAAQTPSPSATASATPLAGVLVASGTPIVVSLVVPLSSASARTGDVFQIVAASDVVVSGVVVVRKGFGGQGHVVKADGAGGNGHSGSLAYAMDYVSATDGSRVPLTQTPQKMVEADRKGATSTLTIVGLATFGLSGLFAHNFVQGHQKVITPTALLTTFTATNVLVTPTPTGAGRPGRVSSSL